MKEQQTFLPRAELLTVEELQRLCSLFIASGTRRIRRTGGEPLVRQGIEQLIQALGRQVETGAPAELTLTTNGTRLAAFAPLVAQNQLKRVNVSLDTRDPDKFRKITRGGDLNQVLQGIAAGPEKVRRRSTTHRQSLQAKVSTFPGRHRWWPLLSEACGRAG